MTHAHDCTGCPIDPDRRTFLRGAAAALGALALLGLVPAGAGAEVPRELASLDAAAGDGRDERRYPIPSADGVSIDRDNGVIIARAGGRVYAFSLACPHQNTALRWNADDRQFQCPKHKSRYRADGAFIEGRATRNMDRLPIRRDGTAIVVDIDGLIQEDEHPAQWEAAFIVA